FILNCIRGPTCTTVLSTQINSQRLRCLSRRRKARKALAALLPLIAAAQADIPVEQPPTPGDPPPPPPAAGPVDAPPPLSARAVSALRGARRE
ncbi:MAG: hypothetical protein LBW77_03920, partial [Verrucomicrobiota bacterium]|nr:hypothetical protein [Verrucomicrobiota bacterium]